MTSRGLGCKVIALGIPDRFIEQGTPAQLRELCGFDKDNILKHILTDEQTFEV